MVCRGGGEWWLEGAALAMDEEIVIKMKGRRLVLDCKFVHRWRRIQDVTFLVQHGMH